MKSTQPLPIGIFTRVFPRASLTATLDAVLAHNIRHVQLSLTCAALPTLPDTLPADTVQSIRQAHAVRGITMSAVSGTFNLIHPNEAERAAGLRRLAVLAAACADLNTGLITLCTGTRDPDNMWRRHPENDSPEAWRDLLRGLTAAAELAETYGVMMGIEPEVSNVVDSAAKARWALDEVRSPRLKIIMDGANLYHTGELARQQAVMDEAFALLGEDIVLAHGKDLRHDGEAGDRAAGTGLLDYDHYLSLLQQTGYTGPLILHSLSENEVAASKAFIESKW